jgi:hypothetical protein
MLHRVVNSRAPMTVVRVAQTVLHQQAAGAMLSVVVQAAGTPVQHEQAVPVAAPVWAVHGVVAVGVAGD